MEGFCFNVLGLEAMQITSPSFGAEFFMSGTVPFSSLLANTQQEAIYGNKGLCWLSVSDPTDRETLLSLLRSLVGVIGHTASQETKKGEC